MTREIVKARFTNVDLTDLGENFDLESGEGSHVVLYKRAGDSQMATVEELQKQIEDLSAKLASGAKASEALEKRAKDAEAKVEELSKSGDDKSPEDEMPDAFRKRFEALEKRALDAEAVAAAERDNRLEAEWIAKSATFKLPGLVPAEFGPIMKRAAIALPKEDVAKIEQILKSASEVVREGKVFSEIGSSEGANTGSAMTEIRKRATELAAKDGISFEKAFNQVVKANPDLALRQREEARKSA